VRILPLDDTLRRFLTGLGVSPETLAMVDTVGRYRTGEFVFTVRWLNFKPGTQQKPRSDRSLNFREQDLAHFEVVQEGAGLETAVPPSHRQPALRLVESRRLGRKRANPNQLSLSLTSPAELQRRCISAVRPQKIQRASPFAEDWPIDGLRRVTRLTSVSRSRSQPGQHRATARTLALGHQCRHC
jgi:hypothetical protein